METPEERAEYEAYKSDIASVYPWRRIDDGSPDFAELKLRLVYAHGQLIGNAFPLPNLLFWARMGLGQLPFDQWPSTMTVNQELYQAMVDGVANFAASHMFQYSLAVYLTNGIDAAAICQMLSRELHGHPESWVLMAMINVLLDIQRAFTVDRAKYLDPRKDHVPNFTDWYHPATGFGPLYPDWETGHIEHMNTSALAPMSTNLMPDYTSVYLYPMQKSAEGILAPDDLTILELVRDG